MIATCEHRLNPDGIPGAGDKFAKQCPNYPLNPSAGVLTQYRGDINQQLPFLWMLRFLKPVTARLEPAPQNTAQGPRVGGPKQV